MCFLRRLNPADPKTVVLATVLIFMMAAAAVAQEPQEAPVPPSQESPATPTDHIPEHLRRAIVYSQRDFHSAAQDMYLAQIRMWATVEGIEFLNDQETAKKKGAGMENYQQQARDYCAAAGLIYSAEQIICVPKPPSKFGGK